MKSRIVLEMFAVFGDKANAIAFINHLELPNHQQPYLHRSQDEDCETFVFLVDSMEDYFTIACFAGIYGGMVRSEVCKDGLFEIFEERTAR